MSKSGRVVTTRMMLLNPCHLSLLNVSNIVCRSLHAANLLTFHATAAAGATSGSTALFPVLRIASASPESRTRRATRLWTPFSIIAGSKAPWARPCFLDVQSSRLDGCHLCGPGLAANWMCPSQVDRTSARGMRAWKILCGALCGLRHCFETQGPSCGPGERPYLALQ